MESSSTLLEKTIAGGNNMDKTEFRKKTETLGALETSILSAHMKFFKGNSEAYCNLKRDDFVLYDTVIRYFTNNS
jgi:hypothetical protein